jgi:hypothetical protein
VADRGTETTIVDKLKELEAHARKLVEAGERNDWREAEAELHKAKSSIAAVSPLVELANDIQRGQVR